MRTTIFRSALALAVFSSIFTVVQIWSPRPWTNFIASRREPSIANRAGGSISILDFGGVADSTTDNNAALAAAENDLVNRGGGTIFFPSSTGCYNFTSTHFINGLNSITYEGPSQNAACISWDFDGDTFSIQTTPGRQAQFLTFRNLSFNAPFQKTRGGAIALRGAYQAMIENISCRNGTYVCVDIHNGPNAYHTVISNLFDANPKGWDAIRIGNDDIGPGAADIFISGGHNIANKTNAAIEISNAGGVLIHDTDVILNNIGMLINPGAGQAVSAVYASRLFLDTSQNAGLKIAPTGTGIFGDSNFTDLWTATNGQANGSSGVLIAGTPNNVRAVSFNNLRSFNNGGHGVQIIGGAHIDFINPQVNFNSRTTSDAYDGFNISAGISNWSIIGGRAGNGSGFAVPNQQRYGINIAAGGSDYFDIAGIDLSGNVTGPLFNASSGIHTHIESTSIANASVGNTGGMISRSSFPPGGDLISGATPVYPIRIETSDYTATSSDFTILGNAEAGPLTIRLPHCGGFALQHFGPVYRIKKIDRSGNAVSIFAGGSETIDGGATPYSLSAQNSAASVQCDNAGHWWKF